MVTRQVTVYLTKSQVEDLIYILDNLTYIGAADGLATLDASFHTIDPYDLVQLKDYLLAKVKEFKDLIER